MKVNKAGQTRDWNSLECQELALREEGAEKIFSEKFSGIKDNRPEWKYSLFLSNVIKLRGFKDIINEKKSIFEEKMCSFF